ncbi:FAD-dependent monooxygenase [Kribbella sp. NBC_00709]|uniref:FAD-dependent monooxygenase n=1 Tax=Kribbella sp. NBC_00709 TaxID=2975972 RepID=UPI002E2A7112|nr:FAD-dependent monooxygenase [Kribbella sp. NBC_00709]
MQLTDGAHHSVVVIGGGQAGLATSWQLSHHGVDHLVLEADRVASPRNRRSRPRLVARQPPGHRPLRYVRRSGETSRHFFGRKG